MLTLFITFSTKYILLFSFLLFYYKFFWNGLQINFRFNGWLVLLNAWNRHRSNIINPNNFPTLPNWICRLWPKNTDTLRSCGGDTLTAPSLHPELCWRVFAISILWGASWISPSPFCLLGYRMGSIMKLTFKAYLSVRVAEEPPELSRWLLQGSGCVSGRGHMVQGISWKVCPISNLTFKLMAWKRMVA